MGLTDEKAVDESFDDIMALAAVCRFSDCRHEDEPGCAVNAAIEAGTLDPERFEAYVKLKAETALASKRMQLGNDKYRKDRDRVVTKAVKKLYKERGH